MKSLLSILVIFTWSCQNIDKKDIVSSTEVETSKSITNSNVIESVKVDTTKNLTTIPYSIIDMTEFYEMELHNSQNNSKVKFGDLSTNNIKQLKFYLNQLMEPKEFEGEIKKLYSDYDGDFLSVELHKNFMISILNTNEINLYFNGESSFYFLYKNCKIRVGADLELLKNCGLNKIRDIHTNKDYIGIYLSPGEQFITMYINKETNKISTIRLRSNT